MSEQLEITYPVPARRHTPRTSTLPSDGRAGAFVAHLHGRTWLPWQSEVADVIGERVLQEDGTWRYRYPIVVVTVPRQCGKTTWAFDLALGRCMAEPDYRAAYTAQSGHASTERFGDRFTELLSTPLTAQVRTRRSQGTERFSFPNRSFLKSFPPKAGALRGSALDLVILDEAQEHGTVLGEQLDLTILPTFTTRPHRQLILIGTAGTDASDYLRRYLAAAQERQPGYALFEWGFAGMADVDDEDAWSTSHPGLNHLTDLDALRTARAAMGPAGFGREYGNVWTRTSARVVDPEDWQAIQDPEAQPAGRLCFSFDVLTDRAGACIVVADDSGRVEMVAQAPDTAWLVPRLRELQAQHRAPIACDRWGASGPAVDELERAGADLLVMSTGDVGNAAAMMLDGILRRTLRVRPSPVLDEAVAGAAQRTLADTGGFAWSRRASAAPVAALIAASNALWGAQHNPPAVRPLVASM